MNATDSNNRLSRLKFPSSAKIVSLIKCVKHGSLALHPLGKIRKGSACGVRGVEIREKNKVWRNVCETAEMNDKEGQRVVGGR